MLACILGAAAYSPSTSTRPAPRDARATRPAMVLGLPRPPTPFGIWPSGPSKPERLREGGTWIDYQMESLHLTKRRVSGGIVVEAGSENIWDVLTAYEQLPEVVPNILSNVVTRRPDGTVTIQQQSLLSRRLNLVTDMTLEVDADPSARRLVLTRSAGHGFLEFVGSYTLQPRASGETYLQYMVELVPCPIFPLPIVEQKIRKEVPKMLLAVRDVARQRAADRT